MRGDDIIQKKENSTMQKTNTVRKQSAKQLLYAGLFGPIIFTVIYLIDGATRPGYNPIHQWISHLSLGERGWIGVINLIVFGFLMLIFSFGMRNSLPAGKEALRIFKLSLLFSIGLIVAGIFKIDPNLGYPIGSKAVFSLYGSIHQLSGVIVFGSLTSLCLMFSKFSRDNTEWKRWSRYSRLSGILVFVNFVICSLLVTLDFSRVLVNAPSGLFERLSMLCGCLWIILISKQMLRNYYQDN